MPLPATKETNQGLEKAYESALTGEIEAVRSITAGVGPLMLANTTKESGKSGSRPANNYLEYLNCPCAVGSVAVVASCILTRTESLESRGGKTTRICLLPKLPRRRAESRSGPPTSIEATTLEELLRSQHERSRDRNHQSINAQTPDAPGWPKPIHWQFRG